MSFEEEISGFSIVYVGAFNPAIFSPLWMLGHSLISQTEYDEAVIDLITPDIVQFKTKNFSLNSDRERFTIFDAGPAPIRTFDLSIRLFGEILVHTPLTQAGVNWERHYRADNWDNLHRIGDILAPKKPWGNFGESMLRSHSREQFRRGGLRSLTMEETIRPDGLSGAVRVTIEPSVVVKPGLFMRLNDHFEINDVTKPTGAIELITLLNDKFDESQARFLSISKHILSL